MCKKWHNNTQTRWLMQITGDPLQSRALAHSRAPLLTQPCPHCPHSRAPGEQWARLCVFTLQGCVQAARLCRGSPVQMSFHEIPKKAYYFLWYKCCSCIYVKRAWCIQCCGVDRGRHRCHNSEQLWSAVPWMKHMRTLSETALSSSLQHEIGAWIIDSYPAVMPHQYESTKKLRHVALFCITLEQFLIDSDAILTLSILIQSGIQNRSCMKRLSFRSIVSSSHDIFC